MIGSKNFDGTARGLNTFIIDLKSTSVSRSWRELFEMTLTTNKRLNTTHINIARTTINYLDNPQAMSFEDVVHYNNTDRTLVLSQKNERKNIHSAVWNTLTHTIRKRIAASGIHIIDGIELVAWIYKTYSMQTEEAQKNFLSKITSVTINM